MWHRVFTERQPHRANGNGCDQLLERLARPGTGVKQTGSKISHRLRGTPGYPLCGPILGFPKAIDEFLKSNAAAITLMTRIVIAGADPMLYSCGRMGPAGKNGVWARLKANSTAARSVDEGAPSSSTRIRE
jgi:hypothetical protein